MSTDNIIQTNSKIRRDNELIFSEMDGETVMMSVERGEYYGIDPIGSRIWGMLETPKTMSELCDTLLPDYDVTREQMEKDVLAFLKQMLEKGIIKIVNDR